LRNVIARSVLCDDREAYPQGKQSTKCQICLLEQEIASGTPLSQ